MSPAAFRLHSLSVAVSAVRGVPGFVPDEYMATLTDADLDNCGIEPVLLAAELCAKGVWEPVAGGYRVLDAEAVQVCVDRVRELREEDARRAIDAGPGRPDHVRNEPAAVGAAGTTRLGDRIKGGAAVSFRCGQCAELAGVVRLVRAGTAAGTELPPGGEPAADALVLDCFLGTSWHTMEEAEVLDAVQALFEEGHVDPAALRGISWTLWYVTPFYCPECQLNYCRSDWATSVDFNLSEKTWACIMGICPNGHQHIIS